MRARLDREGVESDRRGRLPAAFSVLDHHGSEYASPDEKVRGKSHKTRTGRSNKIIKHPVGNCLVERALVAVRPDVELEALQFHTLAIGHVIQRQGRKIRLSGQRTEAGKFRNFHVDQEVPMHAWTWKSLEYSAGF